MVALIAISAAVLVALPRLGHREALVSARASSPPRSACSRRRPLTGQGPGSWAPDRIAFTDASEIDYYIPHAHNVPAQTLAEFGLVGVVAA